MSTRMASWRRTKQGSAVISSVFWLGQLSVGYCWIAIFSPQIPHVAAKSQHRSGGHGANERVSQWLVIRLFSADLQVVLPADHDCARLSAQEGVSQPWKLAIQNALQKPCFRSAQFTRNELEVAGMVQQWNDIAGDRIQRYETPEYSAGGR